VGRDGEVLCRGRPIALHVVDRDIRCRPSGVLDREVGVEARAAGALREDCFFETGWRIFVEFHAGRYFSRPLWVAGSRPECVVEIKMEREMRLAIKATSIVAHPRDDGEVSRQASRRSKVSGWLD